MSKILILIGWLILGGVGRPYKGGPAKSLDYRTQLAKAYKTSAKDYEVPISLLVTIGYRESVFKTDEKGTRGELGIMQVGSYGRYRCKCLNMSSIPTQIACGACWLRMNKDWCGSWEKAVCAYISGKCTAKSPKLKNKLRRRLQLWRASEQFLEKNFEKSENK